MNTSLSRMLIAICCILSLRPALAAEAAATPAAKSLPGPTINVDVTEWVVFVADVVNPELNSRTLFHDSLPPFAEDLRTAEPGDAAKPSEPSPIGVIRISPDGPIDKEGTIDVQLGFKGARVLGHWPRGQVRTGGLLWQDLRIAPESGEPRRRPAGSWLTQLRGSGTALISGTTREPFLLCDLEMAYPTAMQVKTVEGGKYSVAHGMDAPLLDLTFYKPEADHHWRSARIASLSKSEGFPKPKVASPAAGLAPTAPNPFGQPAYVPSGFSGAAQPVAPEALPIVAEIPPDAKIKGTEFAFGQSTEAADVVLAPWRAKLADAGISLADQEVVLKILARQALDPARLTAVYRMDPAELDRLLPMEVVPQPKKISRIALVIVRGIDPALGEELDRCISKLGDPSWKIREAATQEIKKLGVRAKWRLEKAAKSKDAEIAFRAEQLLARIANPLEQATAAAQP